MRKIFNFFDKPSPGSPRRPSWQTWFQEHATFLYASGPEMGELLNAVKQVFSEYFKTESPEEGETEHAIVFSVHQKGRLRALINLDVTYQLYIQPQKEFWAFALGVKPEEKDEGVPQGIPGLATVSQQSLLQQIETAWVSLLLGKDSLEGSAKHPSSSYLPARGHFVQPASTNIQLWQYAFFPASEALLMWLPISSIKKAAEEVALENYEKHDWYYWVSEQRCGITAFAPNRKATVFELSQSPLKAKSEIGRDPIEQGGWAWLASSKSESLYQEAIQFINAPSKEERVRECARLNWLIQSKDQQSNDYAFALMRRLAAFSSNPLDDLALLFMSIADTKRQIILNQENTDEDLLNDIQRALTEHDDKEALPEWVESWNIPPESASSLLSAFLSLREGQGGHLLPLHWWIRERFLAKQPPLKQYEKWEKPLINRLNFELEYLQHLLSAKAYEEALALAQELFACLPPETAQDLIPELSLEEGEGRKQTYRIQLLDFIAQAKQDDPSRVEERRHLARLEPLRLPRLKALLAAAQPPLKERVQHCVEVLTQHDFITRTYSVDRYPKSPLPAKSIEKVQALMPSDLFSKVQGWLASAKTPNLDQVRSYNEQVTPYHDEANLLAKVLPVQRSLRMTPVDCYLTRGERSGEVRGYASSTPFLMVGHDLVNREHPRYLGDAEMLFLLTSEMAHIKFKHAKVTSQDVWRGSVEKGVMAVQFLPMLGGAFKALSLPVHKVPISPIIGKSSKTITRLGNTGLFEYAKAHWDSYLDADQTPEKRDESLLEMSRMMQFVADRIGLILCGDVRASVRALFHASDRNFKNTPFVGMYGIGSLAQQEDEEGRLAYEQLTLRIASLLSFYLTEEYQVARDSVVEKQES